MKVQLKHRANQVFTYLKGMMIMDLTNRLPYFLGLSIACNRINGMCRPLSDLYHLDIANNLFHARFRCGDTG